MLKKYIERILMRFEIWKDLRKGGTQIKDRLDNMKLETISIREKAEEIAKNIDESRVSILNLISNTANSVGMLGFLKNMKANIFVFYKIVLSNDVLNNIKKIELNTNLIKEKVDSMPIKDGLFYLNKSKSSSNSNSQSSNNSSWFKNMLSFGTITAIYKIIQDITKSNQEEINSYKKKTSEIKERLEIINEGLLNADRLNIIGTKVKSIDNVFHLSRIEFKGWSERYTNKIKYLKKEVMELPQKFRYGLIQKLSNLFFLNSRYLPEWIGGNAARYDLLHQEVESLEEMMDKLQAFYEVLYLEDREQGGKLLTNEATRLHDKLNGKYTDVYYSRANFHKAYSYYLNGDYDNAKKGFENQIKTFSASEAKRLGLQFDKSIFEQHCYTVFNKALYLHINFPSNKSADYLRKLLGASYNDDMNWNNVLNDLGILIKLNRNTEPTEYNEKLNAFKTKYHPYIVQKEVGDLHIYEDGFDISYAKYQNVHISDPYIMRSVEYLALTNMYLYDSTCNSTDIDNALKTAVRAMAYTTERDVLAHCVYAQVLANFNKDYDDLLTIRRILERAIEIAPNAARPYYELAKTYYSHGEIRKASELFKKAYELDTISPSIYIVGGYAHAVYNLALINRNTNGTLKEVIEILKENLYYSNENKYLVLPLAKCYFLLGENENDSYYYHRGEEILRNVSYNTEQKGYGEENEALISVIIDYKLKKINEIQAEDIVRKVFEASIYKSDIDQFMSFSSTYTPTKATRPLFWIELGRFYSVIKQKNKEKSCYEVSKSLSFSKEENILAESLLSIYSNNESEPQAVVNNPSTVSEILDNEPSERPTKIPTPAPTEMPSFFVSESTFHRDVLSNNSTLTIKSFANAKLTLNISYLCELLDIAEDKFEAEKILEIFFDYKASEFDSETIIDKIKKQVTITKTKDYQFLETIAKIEAIISKEGLNEITGWCKYASAALSNNPLSALATKVIHIIGNLVNNLEEWLDFGVAYESIDVENQVTIILSQLENWFDYVASGQMHIGLPPRYPGFDPDDDFGGGSGGGGQGLNYGGGIDGDQNEPVVTFFLGLNTTTMLDS